MSPSVKERRNEVLGNFDRNKTRNYRGLMIVAALSGTLVVAGVSARNNDSSTEFPISPTQIPVDATLYDIAQRICPTEDPDAVIAFIDEHNESVKAGQYDAIEPTLIVVPEC